VVPLPFTPGFPPLRVPESTVTGSQRGTWPGLSGHSWPAMTCKPVTGTELAFEQAGLDGRRLADASTLVAR
jgi:hypothetical protein